MTALSYSLYCCALIFLDKFFMAVLKVIVTVVIIIIIITTTTIISHFVFPERTFLKISFDFIPLPWSLPTEFLGSRQTPHEPLRNPFRAADFSSLEAVFYSGIPHTWCWAVPGKKSRCFSNVSLMEKVRAPGTHRCPHLLYLMRISCSRWAWEHWLGIDRPSGKGNPLFTCVICL